MRIYFIIDDATFFLPEYLDGVISNLKRHKVVGVNSLKTSSNHTIYSYIIKNLWRIGLYQIIKISMRYAMIIFGTLLFKLRLSKKPYSILQVAKKHNLNLEEFNKVNDVSFIKNLKKKKVDIVVSSCSAIFKNDLLKVPRIACINRHSGLLPSYGGLFPVFQAMIQKEKKIGVSVHYMVEGIDEGDVIAQEVIDIDKNSTLFSLYDKSYKKSTDATLKAIDIIGGVRSRPKLLKPKASYYSFPKDSDWVKFFKQKWKFI